MPQLQPKNAEGFRLLLGFIAAGKQEAERLGEDWFEVEYVVNAMIAALSLSEQATKQQQRKFRLAQSLAGYLLQELTTDHKHQLQDWEKFDAPKNPAQVLARIFATALVVFERELAQIAAPEELSRMRQQVAATL